MEFVIGLQGNLNTGVHFGGKVPVVSIVVRRWGYLLGSLI